MAEIETHTQTQTQTHTTILGDGSNIAFSMTAKRNGSRVAKYENLARLADYFGALSRAFPGTRAIIFVDASLRYNIDARALLDQDIEDGKVLLCPAGVPADEFIITYARQCSSHVAIVSNDLFRNSDLTPEERREWRYPVMLIQGQIVVPRLWQTLETHAKISRRARPASRGSFKEVGEVDT